MQNSENKGSLSDKFRDFGAAPTEGLWDAISGGLDADNSARQKGPKGPKTLGKSLFWASTGFVAASAIATGIWLTSSKETAVNATASQPSEQIHSSSRAAQPTTDAFTYTPGQKAGASESADKTPSSETNQVITTGRQSTAAVSNNKQTRVVHSGNKSGLGSGNKQHRRTVQNGQVLERSYGAGKEGGDMQHIASGEPSGTNAGEMRYTGQQDGNDPIIDPAADPNTDLAGNNTLPDNDPLANPVTGTGDQPLTNDESGDQSLVSDTPGAENDSIASSSSQTIAPANSGSGAGPLADSSPKGGTATSIRRTLPPLPPKWMIGGHIGLNYGKEVYLIDFQNDQYSLGSADMYAYSPAKYLSTHLYRSADISVSRRVSKRFWLESGLQAGMLYAKQEANPAYFGYQPVEGKVFNMGVPLAVRFDFNRSRNLQFYQRIGTLHTFPYAINARYTYLNSTKPDIWKHRNYWAYTLSVYCNFGMEWAITKNLYWDTRVDIRFMSEMVSMYRNYNNRMWVGGSTGIVWKF
jgi:hypothetical protein